VPWIFDARQPLISLLNCRFWQYEMNLALREQIPLKLYKICPKTLQKNVLRYFPTAKALNAQSAANFWQVYCLTNILCMKDSLLLYQFIWRWPRAAQDRKQWFLWRWVTQVFVFNTNAEATVAVTTVPENSLRFSLHLCQGKTLEQRDRDNSWSMEGSMCRLRALMRIMSKKYFNLKFSNSMGVVQDTNLGPFG
jgi:hypothetical protein